MLQSLKAETRLSFSLPEAAAKLGMARYTLRRRIKANEIRAVRIGSRLYIPNSEMERILNPPTENEELSSNAPNEKPENGSGCLKMRRGVSEQTQKEHLDDLLAGCADFNERYYAGDSEAVAAVAFWDTQEGRARAKEAYAATITACKEYRE